jgi:DNA/RNA endonuclease G (NUC1)
VIYFVQYVLLGLVDYICVKKGKKMKRLYFILLLVFIIGTSIYASGPKPIDLDPSYNHDKWGTQPQDKIIKRAAFTSSFDSDDDNDGDGDGDIWGIPEWVAYEIKKFTVDHPLENRPTWFTDETLHEEGLAPDNETYKVSGGNKIKAGEKDKVVVKTNYRFVRGHMCPKNVAERISANAAYNTHTTINACPQLQWENNGIWKYLEEKCEAWADKYNQIWVICGPVFFNKEPAMWLGQDQEIRAAIPDAFFKIVIKENGDDLDTLAFIIPNIIPAKLNTLESLDQFYTSIENIENVTGLTFLTTTNLTDEQISNIKKKEINYTEW